jgi:predicted small metal-binding protein
MVSGGCIITSLQTSKTLNYTDNIRIVMTLSLNCKDAGDPVCTHTVYGEKEEEVLQNAKKHGIEVHGFTEETWNKEIEKNGDDYRKIMKPAL